VRLEQLVLFGPSDDFRVYFGDRLTVLSGLHPEERTSLIATLVDAMAGQLPNSSVIYVDHAGRRIFADRTGATYADDGLGAPPVSSVVGHDPKMIAQLMLVTAQDLGLGERLSADKVEAELAGAKAAAEQIEAERAEAATLVIDIEHWKAELEELDAALVRAPDDADRWAWMQLRNELDGLRAELAAFDDEEEELSDGDARLIEAVAELRDAGEAWLDADTEATALLQKVGSIPPLPEADLERVSATPAALPDELDERLSAWAAATERRRACEADHLAAKIEVPPHHDELVTALANLDQEHLWPTHTRLLMARDRYENERAKLEGEVDPTVEASIEEAHIEVMRCQRIVDRNFIPGMLGSATFAVGALLAGDQVSILLGVAMLVASVAMGWWLLVVPRKVLADATREEEAALAATNADSWLGLHLRRIDDVMQPADRRGIDAAVDAYGAAQLDWEELTGGADPDACTERRAEVAAHIRAIDPELRRQREEAASAQLRLALEAEVDIRSQLLGTLMPYGLSERSAAELDADQIRTLLAKRVEAGQYARDAQRLRQLQATAASASASLEHVLAGLGFVDGRLETRLERAMEAVTGALHRSGKGSRGQTRSELEAAIAELDERVEAGRRLSWDLTAEPTEAPTDPDDLLERRREVASLLGSNPVPDLHDTDRRLELANDRVRVLKKQLMDIAGGTVSLHRRITDRVARTTWIDDHEESIPVIVDEAFTVLPQVDRVGALDLLKRLSARTQVLILSNDPVVAGWARRNSDDGEVTLFEAAAKPAEEELQMFGL
jgi:hypothetical protein